MIGTKYMERFGQTWLVVKGNKSHKLMYAHSHARTHTHYFLAFSSKKIDDTIYQNV